MKKRRLILSMALLLFTIGVWAQQTHELTVKEAVELAYRNVIEIKNARVDYRIQQAKNKEILGQALPQVSGSVGATYYLKLPAILFPNNAEAGIYDVLIKEKLVASNTPVPVANLVPISFQQPWNLNLGATLNQLLFQPDVFVGLQARQASLDYNTSLIEQAELKIKDSAYKRYYAILIAEKQQVFIDSSIVRLEKLYRDDSIMYVNGFAEKLDLDKVQVQLNNLKTNQTIVRNGIKLAYAALKFSIGLPQSDSVILKEELTSANIKDNILSDGFRYEDRAEIRTLNILKDLQNLDIKRNKLGFLPTASLIGNYGIVGQGQKFFTDNNTVWIKSSYVGVNVNIPIFDGFQRKYKTQQAELSLEKLNNNIDLTRQGIDLEQVITKESLKNSLLSLDIQERNLSLAQRVYNMTKLKFEQGLGSSFEVLQADTDYQTAQNNYFNALYNATVAKISYQYAIGKL